MTFITAVKLNQGQPKFNYLKYPSLKTKHTTAEQWWNSLTYLQKVDAGSFALHICIMSANYPWDCSNRKYCELKKAHQGRINTIFNERNGSYSMFDFKGLAGAR